MISEKLIEEGIEILPLWTDGKPSIVVRKDDKEVKISCVHSVIYQGNISEMPETLSLEGVTDETVLPEYTTLVFALRSFCEAVCAFYPESLEPEMIGEQLSHRMKNAIKTIDGTFKREQKERRERYKRELELARERAKKDHRTMKKYGGYVRPYVMDYTAPYIRNILYAEKERGNEGNAARAYLNSIGFSELNRRVIYVPSPRRDKTKGSFRRWTAYSPFGKKLYSFIEWLRYDYRGRR